MKNSFFKFQYITGKKATLFYWISALDFQGEMISIPDLEIIANENNVIVALRLCSTAEDTFLIEADKGWQLTEAGESYDLQEKRDLSKFIAINSEAEIYHYSYN